jgi:hypothetical protein
LYRNIKTTRLINKLDYKKIRLFKILERIRLVNYKLKLFIYIRINLVFYISLLELVLKNTLVIVLELLKENKFIEYEVEDIIKQAKDEEG